MLGYVGALPSADERDGIVTDAVELGAGDERILHVVGEHDCVSAQLGEVAAGHSDAFSVLHEERAAAVDAPVTCDE